MKTKALVALVLLALLLRVGPCPRQVTLDVPGQPGRVVFQTSGKVAYASEDGSFMFLVFAGCLPWDSCAGNESTDWWIGGY